MDVDISPAGVYVVAPDTDHPFMVRGVGGTRDRPGGDRGGSGSRGLLHRHRWSERNPAICRSCGGPSARETRPVCTSCSQRRACRGWSARCRPRWRPSSLRPAVPATSTALRCFSTGRQARPVLHSLRMLGSSSLPGCRMSSTLARPSTMYCCCWACSAGQRYRPAWGHTSPPGSAAWRHRGRHCAALAWRKRRGEPPSRPFCLPPGPVLLCCSLVCCPPVLFREGLSAAVSVGFTVCRAHRICTDPTAYPVGHPPLQRPLPTPPASCRR